MKKNSNNFDECLPAIEYLKIWFLVRVLYKNKKKGQRPKPSSINTSILSADVGIAMIISSFETCSVLKFFKNSFITGNTVQCDRYFHGFNLFFGLMQQRKQVQLNFDFQSRPAIYPPCLLNYLLP